MASNPEPVDDISVDELRALESSVLKALCLTINTAGSELKYKILDSLADDDFYFPINRALFPDARGAPPQGRLRHLGEPGRRVEAHRAGRAGELHDRCALQRHAPGADRAERLGDTSQRAIPNWHHPDAQGPRRQMRRSKRLHPSAKADATQVRSVADSPQRRSLRSNCANRAPRCPTRRSKSRRPPSRHRPPSRNRCTAFPAESRRSALPAESGCATLRKPKVAAPRSEPNAGAPETRQPQRFRRRRTAPQIRAHRPRLPNACRESGALFRGRRLEQLPRRSRVEAG